MNQEIMKFFKSKMYYIIGLLIVAIVVFVGISLAFFTKVLKSESDIVVKTGDLAISFNNGDTISGDFFPITDSAGMITDGYNFIVENEGSLKSSYKVELYTDTSVEGTPIPHEYLMISFNGEEPKQLSTVTTSKAGENESDNIYLLGTDSLEKNTQKSNVIRVWVKDDAPSSIINNKVALKVKVTSEVGN